MNLNRRDFGKVALAAAAVPAGSLLAAKPNSDFDGVQIGTITYSYRGEPNGAANKADSLLQMIVDSNISAIELMPPAAEAYAGSPAPAQGGGGGGARGGSGGGRGGAGFAPGGPGGPGGAGMGMGGPGGGSGGRRGGGGGRAPMTPEQEAAAAKAAATLKDWRLSVNMSKFEDFRKMYNAAGVSIYCHKLTPTANMSDEEFNYFFNVAKALGAKQVSLELPAEPNAFTQRLGDMALKHGMVAAYHAHEQATVTAWDGVLAQSKGNAVNIDCGHYYAGTGLSPVPALEKLHDRIASAHLKDRTPSVPGTPGANLPWGQGSTPIKEILQAARKNKWKFPFAVELEYQVPTDSTAVVEVKKCVEFCKKCLA